MDPRNHAARHAEHRADLIAHGMGEAAADEWARHLVAHSPDRHLRRSRPEGKSGTPVQMIADAAKRKRK